MLGKSDEQHRYCCVGKRRNEGRDGLGLQEFVVRVERWSPLNFDQSSKLESEGGCVFRAVPSACPSVRTGLRFDKNQGEGGRAAILCRSVVATAAGLDQEFAGPWPVEELPKLSGDGILSASRPEGQDVHPRDMGHNETSMMCVWGVKTPTREMLWLANSIARFGAGSPSSI